MNQIRRALREEPDRLLAHALFAVYGVLALIFRPANQSQTPEFFAVLFNAEFVILGTLLFVGTVIQSYKLKLLGYLLYIIALLTTAVLIAVVSSSVVSVLVLAFAVRGFTSIREMQTGRQFIRELRGILGTERKSRGTE